MTFDPSAAVSHSIDVSVETSKLRREPQVTAEPAAPVKDYCHESLYALERNAIANELRRIKDGIEMLIARKRSGACSAWWTPEHDQGYTEGEAQLKKELSDWKARWATTVDVEKVLTEVFTSAQGRIWELDPDVKRLARVWAGIEVQP
jgi:hypothetical protein